MGMTAKWTCTCDGCGKTHVFEVTLNESNYDGEWEHEIGDWYESWEIDDTAWGPGVPEGWLQVPYDEKSNRHYLFFHDDDCYVKWLASQGRQDDIDAFNDTVPIE